MTDSDPNKMTINTYNQVAPLYVARFKAEHMWDRPLEPAFTRFTSRLPAGARVLDVGCGPGRDVRLFHQQGFEVVGVDLSTGMLGQARLFGDEDYVQADMRVLPFQSAGAAGVWMCASLLHLPREFAPGVFAEARRVLTSGGVLFVTVQCGEGEIIKTNLGEKARFFTLFQPDELISLVTSAGFTVVDYWLNEPANPYWINVIAMG